MQLTSMVASINLGLQFPCSLSNNVVKLGFHSSSPSPNNKRRVSLMVNANSNRRLGGTINNGENNNINNKNYKVNGVRVAEAPLTLRKLKEDSAEEALVTCMHGRFQEGIFVYRQIFAIRSYEIGPDQTATMETILNFLQETALNHVANSGIGGIGFGATRQMSIRKLIWVVTRIQVQVQRYSSWGDIIEIDTWVDAHGKNGMRRDWVIRDHFTKEVIVKATSTWVMMNRETRKLCKIPEEVREELTPFYINRFAISNEDTDSEKIHKLTDQDAENIQTGLAVSFLYMIFISLPMKVLEDYYMTSMTLEFRRECTQSNMLESMATPTSKLIHGNNSINIKVNSNLQFTHLLRLLDDDQRPEVVRARTEWHFKNYANSI
ncbi:palmitoyl-acyl carrier protein thioesterase, chloroplastic-like [Arachis ipaensis]|uniref:palmitoyl-acyl carrier protein thioesterase, chloroplastic-like n=1 Tax=Arachis ipaensis TaxID=130454 RepID=UPI000A2B1283|nr:palmitoyl-acyl carrier protein thioesterase, chloroplastic-like [Arachis ipaensis]